ncbi:MAG: phosphate-selective porin [Myxococcaceae bacterium]|nr:phosphate-selective porin [Myxococcaceae bacterium]
MTTRIHPSSIRLLASLMLAQAGLLATARASAQAGELVVADAGMPLPVAPISAEAVPEDTQVAQPVEVSSPIVESPALRQEAELPALARAQRPSIAPSEPLEPTTTALQPDAEPRYRSVDGDFAPTAKPLFRVGNYRVQASGYVQAQYQSFKQSSNELSPDGLTLLNQSGFAIPRARGLIEGSNDWSSLVLEYDVASLSSAGSGVQRAEATLVWRNPDSPVPYLAGTLGMFRTPFGHEAPRSARDRLFAENATVTQAFFPGQSDIGARVEGGLVWFRYAVAFVNGHPINEPRWGGRAPTKQGDVLGRLGVDTTFGRVRLVGGASLLKGKGFSPGSAATKDSIAVRDVNESGIVTQQSVILQPGRAATASRTFDRWGTGVDLELSAQVVDAWQTWLRGEFMFGSNLDRGLYISDPTVTGFDGRGYGAVAAFENLLWQTGLIGLRHDFYSPNPDATSVVAGDTVKVPRRISTTSALIGLQLPGTRTRLFAEYDRVKDHLALSVSGRPADLKNDRFLCRLQVSLW